MTDLTAYAAVDTSDNDKSLSGCRSGYINKVGYHNIMIRSYHDITFYSLSLPKCGGAHLHSWIRSWTVLYCIGMQLHSDQSIRSVCIGLNHSNCLYFNATAYQDIDTTDLIDMP